MVDRLQEAKRRLPIPELWKRLGLPGECKRKVSAPWRDDRTPSMSISGDGMLWKDFGEDTGGDAVCFLERACDLSRKDACMKLIEMAGCQDIGAEVRFHPVPVSCKLRETPTMPENTVGTPRDHKMLAKLRGVGVGAVEAMVGSGLLRFCEYRGHECWLVCDRDGINGQVRRMDGGKFGDVKAMTLPRSWAKWPVGIGDSKNEIMLVEGGPDLLAAFEVIERGIVGGSAVCMFGASMEIHASQIPLFHRKRVNIIPHNDEAGRNAAAKWEDQLRSVCRVAVCPLPDTVKDLNELVRLPVDEWSIFQWADEHRD